MRKTLDRLDVAYAMRGQQLVAFARKLPVFDRYGAKVCVGDRVKVRRCVGRYGECVEELGTVVDQSGLHGPSNVALYGQFDYRTDKGKIEYASIGYQHATEQAVCYSRHDDFEHGHEKWVEVIA